MFEDFRKPVDGAQSDEDQEEPVQVENIEHNHNFLRMTPVQRLTVAILLLMMTTVIGILFLLVTSKITLPFYG